MSAIRGVLVKTKLLTTSCVLLSFACAEAPSDPEIRRADSFEEENRELAALNVLTPALREDVQNQADPAKRHRVIVALRKSEFNVGTDLLSPSLRDPAALAENQTLIRRMQTEFTDSLPENIKSHMIRTYENIPAMAMELSAEQLRTLSSDVRFESIERMEIYQ